MCSAGDSVLEAQVELQKLAELVPGPVLGSVQPGPGQQLGAGQSSTTLEDTGTAQITPTPALRAQTNQLQKTSETELGRYGDAPSQAIGKIYL